ncbi:aminotransferase class V-fold PLP-dependent enzyme [Plastoroseomonas hellenica]|uniref:aminotransferase class V-fold PLP-dependent enzyme n=1 Tax=Plastoroseomonas hellenica TaxID=2687306 RepID=UPI001BAC47F6|nr:aminotransferase class V-fold PLP-dependent enzyme [Plastoroseomonas hellenica]MBR0645893.1 aminotransferase class V-fold PLP-dependent enzyme [Plastoroseomonas hellenica]
MTTADAWDGLHALFDIPSGITYLDAAFMTPIPRPVREAGEAGVATKAAPWLASRATFYEDVERLRDAAAALIGASAEDIAITAATSYGIATAAQNLPLAAGEAVLTMEGEHNSQVFAWMELAKRSGATHEELPRPEDGDWTRALLARIADGGKPRIAILALTAVHWTDGAALDLVAIGEAARGRGAALVLDGTQSVGVRPIDVRAVQPDFLAFAPYKWLLGPYGIGLLYAAPHRQAGRPLEEHTFSRVGADTLTNHYGRELRFMPGARRYDMGQRANLVTVPMAIAALRLVAALGPERIEAHLAPLSRRLAEGAAALGFAAPRRHAAHLLGLRMPGVDGGTLVAPLRERGVFVSAREGALRIGIHVYNDMADIERALAALGAVSRPSR